MLWDGTAWPHRLERAAWRGGPAGRAADRDLDAVVALFEAAARAEERAGGAAPATFLEELEAQQIPADTLAERALRGDAVRLLTAHRSKGLEWDARRRRRRPGGRLARPAPPRLAARAPTGSAPTGWPSRRRPPSCSPRSAGCSTSPSPAPASGSWSPPSTRPRTTATGRAGSSAELGVPVVPVDRRRAAPPLTLPALVAELRAIARRPATRPSRCGGRRRTARAPRGERDRRAARPLVPAAHPDRWWGLDDPTRPQRPLHPGGRAAPAVRRRRSPGSSTARCAGSSTTRPAASAARSTALGFGSVVHALADARRARAAAPPDSTRSWSLVDRVWDALAFEARWQSRAPARAGARGRSSGSCAGTSAATDGRALVAHRARRSRSTVGVGDREVLLRGSMDRVELDADGRVAVVDLKTGKSPPTGAGRRRAPAARRLPARGPRGRARRRSPGRRAGPAAPSSSSCGDATKDGAARRCSAQAGPGPATSGVDVEIAARRRRRAHGAARTFPPTPGDRLRHLRLPGVVPRPATRGGCCRDRRRPAVGAPERAARGCSGIAVHRRAARRGHRAARAGRRRRRARAPARPR